MQTDLIIPPPSVVTALLWADDRYDPPRPVTLRLPEAVAPRDIQPLWVH